LQSSFVGKVVHEGTTKLVSKFKLGASQFCGAKHLA